MSNLPPGVTQASIDRAYGYYGHSESYPGYLFCDHESAISDEQDRLDEAGLLGSEDLDRLEEAKTEFEDTEVPALSVWSNTGSVTVQFTCPVCGAEKEFEEDTESLAYDG